MSVLEYSDFLHQASRAMGSDTPSDQAMAIVVIDLEGVPPLDSVLGYAAVDAVVREAASILVDALRDTDLVGYTGRHQLACLLPALRDQSHAVLAGHKILRSLAGPVAHGDRRLILSPRIGIALPDALPANVDELLSRANAAMRQARHEREPMQVYSDGTRDPRATGIDLWADLERAIEESEAFMVYQPQLSLTTGKIECAEALLRWTHPKYGPIHPELMVHVAEDTELISRLTLWMLNTALRQCAEYRRKGLDIGLCVNFSAHNLRDPELADLVFQALDVWRVPPRDVVIEITETAVMEENHVSLDGLRRLKDMGLELSMDDFGTGHSSMARLCELPLDELKIDRSFIRNMLIHPTHERVVDSIIGLAHTLGLRVVAEGVEEATACERLQRLGCDRVQGYLVGRPMPWTDFVTAVSDRPGGDGTVPVT